MRVTVRTGPNRKAVFERRAGKVEREMMAEDIKAFLRAKGALKR